MNQPRLTTIPATPALCNRVVSAWHRHHAAPPSGLVLFCLAAVNADTGSIVGVAIVGRPANRNSDDGQTGEVLRVATDGTPNACSVLYGAAAAAARRMGFARLITYTLDSEPGSSLRGAGWTREADGIQSNWSRYPWMNAAGQRRRTVVARDHYDQTKTRWAVTFRDPVPVTVPELPAPLEHPSLFGLPDGDDASP